MYFMATNMQTNNRTIPALDLTLWITMGGALLYLAGSFRLFFFMGHFQASLFILDIPVEIYLLNGFLVLFVLFVLALIFFALYLIFFSKRIYQSVSAFLLGLQGIRALLALIFMVLVFVAAIILMAQFVAYIDYELQRKSDFSEYHPRVQVWLKPTIRDDSAMADLSAYLAQGCYRLLVQDQKMLFLFAHPPGMQPDRWPVIVMPLDEVIALRGLPQHETPKCLGFSPLKEKEEKGP